MGEVTAPSSAVKLVIKIAITQAAFAAIASTLPLGIVGYANEANERGVR
jgi:hypothetical protein